ncbi:MAG: S8 family serine peptidase, partial [Actinomycetota bacterium]|nr:S8 family serine peptidase [Actinomycetota bacterium]
ARIQAKGTLVVAAAGNEATCRVSWPSALPGVIAVGALGPDGPAPFTNYGSWVTACAPGVDIVSRFFDGVDVHDDGDPATADFRGWAKWSGTSFSAPIVAAAIAREASLYGISIVDAVQRVIFDPRLFRIPGLGTVVNLH